MNNVYSLHHATRHKLVQFIPNVWQFRQQFVILLRQNHKDIRQAKLVIWSIPLYAYGVPSHCKALMDRTVSFNSPMMYIDSDGVAHHYGYEEGSGIIILVLLFTSAKIHIISQAISIIPQKVTKFNGKRVQLITKTCSLSQMFGTIRNSIYLCSVKTS